jgi:hypothetical protein
MFIVGPEGTIRRAEVVHSRATECRRCPPGWRNAGSAAGAGIFAEGNLRTMTARLSPRGGGASGPSYLALHAVISLTAGAGE